MGSALYVSIKDKSSNLDTLMNGKALARAWEALDQIAEKLKLPNLNKLCNNVWKSPEKGLPIFEAYLTYITQYPESVPDTEGVVEDLKDIIRLIGEASKLGTKWRLLLDY